MKLATKIINAKIKHLKKALGSDDIYLIIHPKTFEEVLNNKIIEHKGNTFQFIDLIRDGFITLKCNMNNLEYLGMKVFRTKDIQKGKFLIK